ncbi:MAG: hypothetical protein V4627_09230 [Pseudomonadota bacterium]
MPTDATTPLPPLAPNVLVATGIAMDVLGLPFDIARAQYARAVQLGLVERSMLASSNFARTLGALEQLALGPWARRV